MKLADWTLLSLVAEGEAVEIEGVDVWWHEWHRLDIGTLKVPHPSYQHQSHTLWPYVVETDAGTILFCAGEVSNGVWCFYVAAKGQPSRVCKGMTVNERLADSNLLEDFDLAVRARNEGRAKDILIATGLTRRQASDTAEVIVANPRAYGF